MEIQFINILKYRQILLITLIVVCTCVKLNIVRNVVAAI